MIKCSESNIRKVYLMMGFACNFQCRYCLQTGEHRPGDKTVPVIQEKVWRYLERLIKCRNSETGKLRIMFWGGEPLLYKDIIRQVVERFQDRADYGLVTNGALIDEDFVAFANDHDIAVSVSHDGPETSHTRGCDIWKEDRFRSLFAKLKHKGINGVLSAYNYDFLKTDSMYPVGTYVGQERLVVNWGIPDDICKVPGAEYAAALKRTANKAYQDILSGNLTNAASFFLPVLKRIVYQDPEYKSVPTCGQFYRVMNVDLAGNVYVCHNSSVKIGTVDDLRIRLAQRYEAFLSSRRQAICEECPYMPLCHGGCPLELTGKAVSCQWRKAYFATAVNLAERLINSYEPIDLEV